MNWHILPNYQHFLMEPLGTDLLRHMVLGALCQMACDHYAEPLM